MPLLEFDPAAEALIEPRKILGKAVLPERCVLPFYGSLIKNLRDAGKLARIRELFTSGMSLFPIDVYKLAVENKEVAVAFPGLGAPFAGATMEELIALGCRKFVACGSCGVLDPALSRGMVVIPSCALRDEGTSYHYLPPSRLVEMDTAVREKLESVLRKHHLSYASGKTWTTDAFYRETRQKIARRKAEGCITVDMECSAMMAIARFRGVAFGQYLAAGDDISGDEWDPRYSDKIAAFQEKIFQLSVEACLSL